MGNVREIPSPKRYINDNAKELLTAALEQVESEGVGAVAMVTIHPDGTVGSEFAIGDNFYQVVGALEQLKVEILMSAADADELPAS